MNNIRDKSSSFYVCSICGAFKEDHILLVSNDGTVTAGIKTDDGYNVSICSDKQNRLLSSNIDNSRDLIDRQQHALEQCWRAVGSVKSYKDIQDIADKVSYIIGQQQGQVTVLNQFLDQAIFLLKSILNQPSMGSDRSWISNTEALIKESNQNSAEVIATHMSNEKIALERVAKAADKVQKCATENDSIIAKAELRNAIHNWKTIRSGL